MSEGSQRAEIKSCVQLQEEYSVLIRDQMQKRGVSVRKLVNEGVVRRSHRNRFFERIAEGSLPIAEFHAVSARLEIDPIRAAITVQCFSDPASYEDPCCETSALVAIAMATHPSRQDAASAKDLASLADQLSQRRTGHRRGSFVLRLERGVLSFLGSLTAERRKPALSS